MNKLIQKILGGRCEIHAARQKQALHARTISLVDAKGITGIDLAALIKKRLYGV